MKQSARPIWPFRKHLYICVFPAAGWPDTRWRAGKKPKRFLNCKKLTTVAYENNDKKMESIYSKRIRAGKRRTYFFDVRATRGNDYYLTITESRKRFDDNGYDRHKVFLYKEDFNKFIKALGEAVDYVKTELMPDFDFDAFNHEESDDYNNGVEGSAAETSLDAGVAAAETIVSETPAPVAETGNDTGSATEEVDKW
jgi:Protein of unknown function (DUF3276)